MSSMKYIGDERGGSTAYLALVITLAVLFVGAGAFGLWAFTSRQDYKNNVERKIGAAVAENTKQVQTDEAKKFAEAEKQPLKQYIGSEQYGSVHINYPKTWSAYVASSSTTPVDVYMNPDFVPSTSSQASVFALRVMVVARPYSQVASSFSQLQKTGKVTIAAYELPRNKGIVGSRIDGQITQKKRGAIVLLPLRDKTLQIMTESEAFLGDFNNIILPNASFSP